MKRAVGIGISLVAVGFLFLRSFWGLSEGGTSPKRGEHPWGEYSTTLLGRTVAQRHNITLAAARLDGVILSPGATFSFAKALGPATAERGFLKANAIRNGELSPEFGGGICQLSSTVYNAALRANLKIVERHRHLWRVKSVPPGLDAAVFYGNYDLKLLNDSGVPLVLHVRTEGDRLIASITGPRPSTTRVYITRRYSFVERQSELVVPDTHMSHGDRAIQRRGMAGCRVLVERITEVRGGKRQRETVSQDYYPTRDKVVLVGVKP